MNTAKYGALCLLVLFASPAYSFVDGFVGPVLDPIWEVVTVGQGPSVSQGGGELLVTIPGNSVGGGDWGSSGQPWISTGCRATCEIAGDFIIQVDFRLIDWPALNGVRAGIGTLNAVAGEDGVLHRMSTGPDGAGAPSDYFVVHANSGPISVETDATSGSLRLARIGSSWIGFYDGGSGWTEFGTVSGPTGPIRPEIRLWCHASAFGGEDVSVAFDNFVVVLGNGCAGIVSVEDTSLGSLKALYR